MSAALASTDTVPATWTSEFRRSSAPAWISIVPVFVIGQSTRTTPANDDFRSVPALMISTTPLPEK